MAFKIIGEEKRLDDNGSDVLEYETVQCREWDVKEHVGDKQFMEEVSFDKKIDNGHPTMKIELCRPADFDEAERWVLINIKTKANRERMISMFDKMRVDQTIHFWFSL